SKGNELAIELLAPEGKELVFENWAADLVADIVIAKQLWIVVRRICDRVCRMLLIEFIKCLIGVQAFMAMEETHVAVPVVGTALGRHRKLTASGFAEFGLVVRSNDFEFFDGVGIDGDVRSSVVARIDVRRAVDRVFMLVCARSVDAEISKLSNVARLVQVGNTSNPRDQLYVVEDVPTIHGDVVQLLARNEVRTLAEICL